MPATDYDAIVIGAGSGGEVLATELAGAGWRTAIVEDRLVGGDCPFWACMPSKALLRPAAVTDLARRQRGVDGATLDPAAVFAWRDGVVNGFDDSGHAQQLADDGVDVIRGRGRLAGDRCVVVEGPDGHRSLRAERCVVLATGSTPVKPPIDGLPESSTWSSADATTTHDVPARLLVLGGGPVGCELGQFFARLGSAVRLIDRDDHLLGLDDAQVAAAARSTLESDGVDVRTGVEAVSAASTGTAVTVALDDGEEVTVDRVLVAAGREPRLDGLGLESIGVTVDDFSVDERLCVEGVAGDWLLALGDVVGRAPTTHHAKYEARMIADRLARGRDGVAWADDRAAVQVTFLDPPVAVAGVSAGAARAAGRQVDVRRFSLADTATAYVHASSDAPSAGVAVVEDGRVVGVEMAGPGADEVLHAFTVAIVGEVPLDLLHHAVPAFPTQAEIWLDV